MPSASPAAAVRLPAVTVVIVHHRGVELIERCLAALAAGRGVRLEAVVVANDCREEIPRRDDLAVHVVPSSRPLGFSAANNLGVEWARRHLPPCDAYLFLNDDTEVEPDAVAVLARHLGEEPRTGVVGPLLVILGAEDHVNSLGLNVSRLAESWDEGIGRRLASYGPLPGPREVLAVTGSALLIRAAALDEIGGWSELFGYYLEDVDLCLRARGRGWRVLHDPRARVRHAVSATAGARSDFKTVSSWRNQLLLIVVHWPARLLARVLPFLAGRELAVFARRLLAGPRRHALLQARAWAGAALRLPRALAERRRTGGRTEWVELLRPIGSVPVIRLPPRLTLAASRPGAHRLLVAGLCPLPFENTTMSFGPGIRSWQLASALAADGHDVTLVAMEIPGCYEDAAPAPADERVDGVRVVRLDEERFADGDTIRRWIEEVAPDAVVGATVYGSHALAGCAGELPFWADQFGHVMAEAQARAALDGDNRVLPYFWRRARRIGLRADRVSAVSARQRLALIGELGALGRLSAETCGYELVAVAPCAVVPALAGDASSLRGSLVPSDAFVVLWSGSFNVWSDVDTLFAGVERAMGEEPRLRFVSTGAAIAGHDEVTYRRFVERVAASPLGDRFHLQGWVPAERVADYQALADLGVLTERPIYEGELGSKNRVVQWLGSGLPVAYNRVGDLGDLLAGEGLGLTFPPGDAAALAERILWASRNPEALREMAVRARRYAAEHLSFAATTVELRRWAAAPVRAPDHEAVAAGLADPGSYGSALREAAARAAEGAAGGPAGRLARLVRRLGLRLRRLAEG